MNRIVFGMLIFLLLIGGFFFAANVDFYLNPWIKDLQLSWWNFFTTEHYTTWLYWKDLMIWLLLVVLISVSVAVIVTLKKDALTHR